MKAYKLYAVGDLRYEDCEIPDVPSGWALVNVRACGICSSDIARIYKKGTYKFPTIPGHEFSGIVAAVGNKSDAHWVGKRVSVFPLIPCGKCEQCKSKRYEMCENYNYLGSRCDGGFAEYVVVPVWNIMELGENVDYSEGAMFEPMAVALHCVNQARIAAGDTVAIIGSGAIAFAVAQWAKYRGVKEVCVVGRSNDKRKVAGELSLDYLTTEELSNRMYDTVVEAVGSQDTLGTAILHTKAGGKIVAMGNPTGDMTLRQDVYWRILRKQLNIIGTWNSVYDGPNQSEWLEVRDTVNEGAINISPLISQSFSQECVEEGLQLMKNHTKPYCKIMTLWGEQK